MSGWYPASKLKVSPVETSRSHEMFFGKSIAFDEEDLENVAVATGVSSAYSTAETEFIERLRSGDAEAFDLLITRYSADVFALLQRLTGDSDEAGDLTQETFLSALKAIKGFRGESELKTWLFRIAVNHSRNRFRWWKRRSRDKTISLDTPVGDGPQNVGDMLPHRSLDPEETTLRLEREAGIKHALSGMPDIFREVIVLCDIEGLTYEEIGRALEISIGTVKSRVARGREDLRRRLKDF
jgi:RNA polymerase sigma-70 factor (ECF subfamily)